MPLGFTTAYRFAVERWLSDETSDASLDGPKSRTAAIHDRGSLYHLGLRSREFGWELEHYRL